METAVEDGDTPVVNTSDTSDKIPSAVDAEKPAEKVAFFSYIYSIVLLCFGFSSYNVHFLNS